MKQDLRFNCVVSPQVELESLRREMKGKQLLLAQAGKAIELMEEQHSSELQKLHREMAALEARFRHPVVQRLAEPLDNSMQLYADAFNVRHSLLVPSTVKAESEQIKQVSYILASREGSCDSWALNKLHFLQQSTLGSIHTKKNTWIFANKLYKNIKII